MRYMVQQPIIPQYYPPQSLGQTAPIKTSTWWILGALGLGLYLWGSSERKHSRLF